MQLPQADAKSLQQTKEPVLIVGAAGRQLYLTLPGAKRSSSTSDALSSRSARSCARIRRCSVLVGGDERGSYGGVFKVLADLQQAGVAKVGLMGQPNAPAGQGKSASHGRK